MTEGFSFQASGVKVSEEVKQKYDDIKKKKCHRYMVFFIKDEKTIAVEKIGKFLKLINVSLRWKIKNFSNTHWVAIR